MKNFKCISFMMFLFSSLFLTGALFAQAEFTGKLTMEMTEGSQEGVINYFVKDNFVKMDMSGEKGSVIFKQDAMYILMDEMKMYMEIPLDNESEEITNDQTMYEDTYAKTGETKTIEGISCEQWMFTDPNTNHKTEIWVTDQLGTFFLMNNPKSNNKDNPLSEIFGDAFFPMLMIESDAEGNIKNTLKVTKVEKMELEDSFFEVPSDYKKMGQK